MAKKRTTTSILHEVLPNGHHRIVQIAGTKITVSNWAERSDLAVLGEYIANLTLATPLPVGVFTVQEVKHCELV